jgi:predicted GH43/DUF377 family glycosyl hydrolase
MKLNRIHQEVIRLIEPIPSKASELETLSILDRSTIHIGKTITEILRSFRRNHPMNWDPWILKDSGPCGVREANRYRMFYLQGVEGQTPWWITSHICGAVSTDLHHWEDLGILIAPNPEQPLESGRISAGCALKENDTLYLFYSSGGKEGKAFKSEAIGLATSTDGLHWQRHYDHFPLVPTDDDPWYGRCNWTNHFHWRDPYVFKDPKSGQYHMFICASSKTPGHFQGCVGLAVSDRIDGPYKIQPPVAVTPPETADKWPFYHMERPQVIFKNNQYHLFFSCFRMFLNPAWVKQHPRHLTTSSLHWYVFDRITGPYRPAEINHAIVPGSETTGLYATSLLDITPGSDEFMAYGWYHRLHALEVSPQFRMQWNRDRWQLLRTQSSQFVTPKNCSQTLHCPEL